MQNFVFMKWNYWTVYICSIHRLHRHAAMNRFTRNETWPKRWEMTTSARPTVIYTAVAETSKCFTPHKDYLVYSTKIDSSQGNIIIWIDQFLLSTSILFLSLKSRTSLTTIKMCKYMYVINYTISVIRVAI